MGCGQSRMGMVYPRKWKARNEKRKGVANPLVVHIASGALYDNRAHYLCSSWRKASAFLTLGGKSDRLSTDDNDYDDDAGPDASGDSPGSGAHPNGSGWENGVGRRRFSAPHSSRTHRPLTVSGPILAQAELSNSQLDFFRMLDEKIESGRDYESEDDLKDQQKKSLEKPKFSQLNPILQHHDPYLQQKSRQGRQSTEVVMYDEGAGDQQRLQANPAEASQSSAGAGPPHPALSSWPNGSLTNYEGESFVSRGLRSPMTRESLSVSEDAPKAARTVKSESRSKSWFSEPHSSWPLRKLSDALRDDRDKSNNAKRRGAGAKDPSKRKSVA